MALERTAAGRADKPQPQITDCTLIGLAFLGARQANNHQGYLVCFQLFIHSARTTAEEPINSRSTHPEPLLALV